MLLIGGIFFFFFWRKNRNLLSPGKKKKKMKGKNYSPYYDMYGMVHVEKIIMSIQSP